MLKPSLNRRSADVDVCLLLEGTFPYVRGGVSSWVDEIIRAFPEFRFGVAFLGSRPEDYSNEAYSLPHNVVHFEAHYLHEHSAPDLMTANEIPGDAEAFAASARLHAAWRGERSGGGNANNNGLEGSRELGEEGADTSALMARMAHSMTDGGMLDERQFLSSRAAWDYIVEQYHEHCTDPSFTDYFWTVRIMHKPLWQLARIAHGLPHARVYHTISTGYAGFLGALLHYRTGRPLIVSEHGIYTKERKIDLLQTEWIRDNRGAFERDVSKISYFRELWVRFFEALGRLAYDAADQIVALYEANRQRQIADGADPARTSNIPNGVDVDALAPLVARRADGPRRVCALIGRVVPIKDVKTFIRGIFMASRTMPDIEGWIVGPEEEDPDYAEECRALAQSLGLARNVRFFGFQRVSEMLPRIDLVVLTSISEALPLVVLEGFAAGVPAITTDVGSCRQLIEGGGEADRALGSAGMIVPIANPAAFAQAALTLLGDDARWRAAQRAGLARVRQFYGKQTMIDRYRSLYTRLSQAPGREGGTVDGGDAHRRAFERCPVHDGSAMAANPNPARHTGGGR